MSLSKLLINPNTVSTIGWIQQASTSPPASPIKGMRVLVADPMKVRPVSGDATGDFAGKDGNIVIYNGTNWEVENSDLYEADQFIAVEEDESLWAFWVGKGFVRLPNEVSSKSSKISISTADSIANQELKPDAGIVILHDLKGDGKKSFLEPKDVNGDGTPFTADPTFNKDQWQTVEQYNVGQTYYQAHELTHDITLSTAESSATVTVSTSYPPILQYGDKIQLHIKNGTDKTTVNAVAYGGDTWATALPNGATLRARIPWPLSDSIAVTVTGGSGTYKLVKSIIETKYWTRFLTA